MVVFRTRGGPFEGGGEATVFVAEAETAPFFLESQSSRSSGSQSFVFSSSCLPYDYDDL